MTRSRPRSVAVIRTSTVASRARARCRPPRRSRSRRPGRAARRGRSSSRAGRASAARSASPTSQRICGNAAPNVAPSTAIRQWRARAPSMTSMPRSSASPGQPGSGPSARTCRSTVGPGPVGRGRAPPSRRRASRAQASGRRSARRRPGRARRSVATYAIQRKSVAAAGSPTSRPSPSGAVDRRRASGWSAAPSRPIAERPRRSPAVRRDALVGPKREADGGDGVAQERDLVGDRRAGEQTSRDERSGRPRRRPTGEEPSAAQRRAALDPPGQADPGEQAGRQEGEEPRVGGLERRQQRLRARRQSWPMRPPMDGMSTAARRRRAQTISGNARAPRATGGQTMAAMAIATGRSIVTPTTTSSGPPGPIDSRTRRAATAQQPSRAAPISRSSKLRTRTPRVYADRRDPDALGRQVPQVRGTPGPPGHRDAGAPGHEHAPHRTGPPGGRQRTEGSVSHGRPGTARVTGTRAIISPRLVVAARGGLRGRVWARTRPGDTAASRQTHGQAVPRDEGHLPDVPPEGTGA